MPSIRELLSITPVQPPSKYQLYGQIDGPRDFLEFYHQTKHDPQGAIAQAFVNTKQFLGISLLDQMVKKSPEKSYHQIVNRFLKHDIFKAVVKCSQGCRTINCSADSDIVYREDDYYDSMILSPLIRKPIHYSWLPFYLLLSLSNELPLYIYVDSGFGGCIMPIRFSADPNNYYEIESTRTKYRLNKETITRLWKNGVEVDLAEVDEDAPYGEIYTRYFYLTATKNGLCYVRK